MRFVLAILITLAAGTFAGLALTYASVTRGVAFNAVKAGPWSAWPRAGSPDAEPYGAAARARSGDVPAGPGEGLALFAAADDTGRPLDARCDYRISGPVPAARYWTLTLYDAFGRRLNGPPRRHGFTSAEVIREMDGTAEFAVSWRAQPGNWLSASERGSFVIALRLYDTFSSAAAFTLDAKSLPQVKRGTCA